MTDHDQYLTAQECCDLYTKITGRPIKLRTWLAYDSRRECPERDPSSKPRKPVWSRASVLEWIAARPRALPKPSRDTQGE